MTIDPATLVETRLALQSVAEHVMAAARHQATGRIGLRPSRGGFTTPPFPSPAGPRTIAVDGTELVVTDDRGERREPLTTVAAAARMAEVEPGAPADVFTPATPLAPNEPLAVHPAAAKVLADWYALGAAALEAMRAELTELEPTELQLWPEHFDLGFQAAEVNWGASPGDAGSDEPYLYVGPWTPPPPDGGYWNETFGASRPASQVTDIDDALAFYREGRRQLGL